MLALTGLHKSFPGVKALSNVSLRLFPGEVHALMGQNGAGKSTLIKVLTGLYTPDAGTITLDGKPIAPKRTEDAQALGIRTVYQEVNLCPNLSVAENICAGRFPRTIAAGWLAASTGPPSTPKRAACSPRWTWTSTSPRRCRVTRCRSSRWWPSPARCASRRACSSSTSPPPAWTTPPCSACSRCCAACADQGLAILFVTHFLDQTYALADRITVMRNGETEGEYLASDLSRLALVNKMVGAPPDQQPTRLDSRAPVTGAPVLQGHGPEPARRAAPAGP